MNAMISKVKTILGSAILRRDTIRPAEYARGQSSKHWKLLLGIVPMLGLLLCAAPETWAKEQARLASLEGLVEQLSELQLEKATERRQWREQKPRWEREIELLQAEEEQLETELARYREEQSDLAQDQERLLKRRKELNSWMERMERLVGKAETDLRDMRPMLPQPLLGDFESALEELPENAEDADNKSITRRVQKVLALYSGIQKLQHEVHAVRSVIDLGESRREMDVLYIGLAQAFAVSSNGKIAALGKPGAEGWEWKRNDNIAPSIRAAIAVHRREEPAKLVPLPLEIAEEGE